MIDALSAQGMMEVWTDSFMRVEDLDRLRVPQGDRLRDLVTLMNPLAETGEAMRTTIVPGLLRVAARNINRGNKDLALYELSLIHISEPTRLGMISYAVFCLKKKKKKTK